MTPARICSLALAVTVLSASPVLAQNGNGNGHGATGRIVGRVLDAAHGTPLSGAQVSVAGTTNSATSAVDGRYTLLNVPADAPVEIRVRRIGYQPKAVSEVTVPAGRGVEQDVALTAEIFTMEAISVTASAERGSASMALEEVRNASTILSSLSAELIRKTPDGDAGQAVQRVAGVTVQDGKYVFVRGLGERYTTTSLNGARIPSPEPEKKVVPLDLFPSGLLDGITTSKTFTPDQPGDFSGAQVNLKTREFPLGRVISFSTSLGFNDAATGKSVLRAPTLGSEWLGLAGSGRNLPSVFTGYESLNGVTPALMNQLIASFRNSWTAEAGNGTPNGGLSMSIGGEDPVFGRLIGYIGSFTYSYGQEIRADERRAVWGPSGVPENSYRGQTARSSVTWGGLLNLSTRIGATSKITLNNTVTLSGDNEASRVAGYHDTFQQQLDITRLTFVERMVRSNQLAATHLFGERHNIEWTATTSAVRRREPDRSDLAYIAKIDSATWTVTPVEWFGATRSATRTFSDIREHIEEGTLSYRLALGDPARQTHVKVGGLTKLVSRLADTRPYDITSTSLTQAEKQATPDQIFSGAYAQAGRLFLQANGSLGRYDASDELYAGYLQFEIPVGTAARVIGGARVEHSRITVDSRTQDLGISRAKLRDTDVLPSLALMIKAGSTQNIRFSATQTLSRPEYRELSPTNYFDILGGQKVFGDPGLKRALVQNYDARWEWYPGSGQTISIAAFAKRFQHPIERVLQATSDANAPDATFDNAKSARNYGVELELRHSLGVISPALAPFTLFANTTLMDSRISLDSTRNPTNPERPMVGQSEYIVNAGLGYSAAGGRLTATVLYNVAGPRIFEAGISPFADAYEQSRHLLDASIQLPLFRGATIKLDAKNLLDAPYRLIQGAVERLTYRTGRTFSAGVSWKP